MAARVYELYIYIQAACTAVYGVWHVDVGTTQIGRGKTRLELPLVMATICLDVPEQYECMTIE